MESGESVLGGLWSLSIHAIVTLMVSLAAHAARMPFEGYSSDRLPKVMPSESGVVLVDAFPNVRVSDPIDLVELPDEQGWMIVSKRGQVYWTASPSSSERRLVLDRSQETVSLQEGGMYSLVLHPDFGKSGMSGARAIFVFYQYSDGNPGVKHPGEYVGGIVRNRLSRFELRQDTVEVLPGSESVLLEQVDRGAWHQGGSMLIHPHDGYLYLTMGDEGVKEAENVQSITNNLFGGVLRIDIRSHPERSHPIRRQPRDGRTSGYRIPDDNPFVDPDGGRLEEFFAVGLRSPHTLVLDSLTGELFCGDVGSALFEEINLIQRAGNYGWGSREGLVEAYYAPPVSILGGGFRDPYYAYDRRQGPSGEIGDKAVICGPVYRGAALDDRLGGRLIFGDNVSGRVWGLTLEEDPAARTAELLVHLDGSILTGLARIVADRRGELYCLQLGENGRIWKMAASSEAGGDLPATLSETGVFSDLTTLQIAAGFVEYDLNQPFWSDGAHKRRWVAIPNDGPPYLSGEEVEMRQSGSWVFPPGSVFVKHFEFPKDEATGETARRLETRLLVVDANSEVYGSTYKWREDQSDADLVVLAETGSVVCGEGVYRAWYYPSSSDCRTCHSRVAGFVLGLNTRQMNRETETGDNQIELWETLGLGAFTENRGSSTDWGRIASLNDDSATLTERVRGYLDVNCAFCHLPEGRGPTFDARIRTPLAFQGLVDSVSRSNGGSGRGKLIDAGHPGRSELLARLQDSTASRMPPVGTLQTDRLGVDTIRAWVTSLTPATNVGGFAVQYFTGSEFELPVASSLVDEIDEDWGQGSPTNAMPNDGFSVRWNGLFTPDIGGEHVIVSSSDGGIRIWIDGSIVLDAWTDGGAGEISLSQGFSAGTSHEIAVDYKHVQGLAMCRVRCHSEGNDKNLFTDKHVRVSENRVHPQTRPVIGASLLGDGQRLLQVYPEGDTVGLLGSVDLREWTPIVFSNQLFKVTLTNRPENFFRLIVE